VTDKSRTGPNAMNKKLPVILDAGGFFAINTNPHLLTGDKNAEESVKESGVKESVGEKG
jgi:hypothetical protein